MEVLEDSAVHPGWQMALTTKRRIGMGLYTDAGWNTRAKAIVSDDNFPIVDLMYVTT
jgi:hypothetical protein